MSNNARSKENKKNRKSCSIEKRVFRSALKSSFILGLVAFIIGITLYSYALTEQYYTHAFQLSKNAAGSITKVIDVIPMINQTMDIYRSQTEQQRNENATEKYTERFSKITEFAEYKTCVDILSVFREGNDVFDIYLAMYDKDTSTLVYIADPGETPENICLPGEWDSVDTEGMYHFLNWNGEGKLYDTGYTEKYGWICTAGVPIYNETGDIAAFVLTDITLDNLINGMKSFVIWYLFAIVIATVLLAELSAHHMKKAIVQPINAISDAAKNYVKDKIDGANKSGHFTDLNIQTGDEIEQLSHIMADMECELTQYIDNITRITAEKERVTTELDMGKKIQESMLPNEYPAFPNRKDFDIFARMDPAKEVGGDFFDYFLIDDDHLYIVMADVSGKGVPAALFMMA